MGKIKKFGLVFVITFGLLFTLIMAVGSSNNSTENNDVSKIDDSNSKMEQYQEEQGIETNKNVKLDTEEKVLNFIRNYKGNDNSGPTFFDTLDVLLNVVYPNENIVDNPSTTGYFIATQDYSKEISDRYWKVEFKLETYKDSMYWILLVDTKTKTVYAGNQEAKDILLVLDSFDK